jgi:hypothetical protein
MTAFCGKSTVRGKLYPTSTSPRPLPATRPTASPTPAWPSEQLFNSTLHDTHIRISELCARQGHLARAFAAEAVFDFAFCLTTWRLAEIRGHRSAPG